LFKFSIVFLVGGNDAGCCRFSLAIIPVVVYVVGKKMERLKKQLTTILVHGNGCVCYSGLRVVVVLAIKRTRG
jgi:hypothetical protein